jgi:uncharacterized protein involved in exopolysaccharide biosynthesis
MLLLLLLFVPVIIGLVVGYVLPRSYQASATLWALQRFEDIGATEAQNNLEETPATTQADALMELLHSRAFDIAIGDSTDLKSTLRLSAEDLSNPRRLDDAYVADISKNVQVTANGTNLYQVTYTNSDPRIAAQVLKAIIDRFQSQGQQFSSLRSQRLLVEEDQAQLTKLRADANTAAADEAAYLASHPGATTANDPQYALLDGERQQAQSVLRNMEKTIASLQQDLATQSTGGGPFFKTLDPPVQPDKAVSRLKVLTTTVGIGAAAGLVVCILYILILVRRDRALYTVLAIEKATSYPVLMKLHQIPDKTKGLVMPGVIR